MAEVSSKDVDAILSRAEAMLALAQSRGWKMLMKQLALEREEAKEAICHVDPNNTGGIEALQRVVYRYDWLEQTVDAFIQQAVNLEAVHDEEAMQEDPSPQERIDAAD